MTLQKYIVDIVSQLRRNQTPFEELLWRNLRNRKLNGFKFLRQHPIVYGSDEFNPAFFVADFYCDEKKLVVELDGKIHDFQKDYDANRDAILSTLGLRTLRIRNEELGNLECVLQNIHEHLISPFLLRREG